MMRLRKVLARLLRRAAVIGGAIGLGTALTFQTLKGSDHFDQITMDGWVAQPDAGTSAANPYARARRARDASLSIGAAEGITFYAARDTDGNVLTSACDYIMEGKTPPARLWTLFPVGANHAAIGEASMGLPVSLHSGQIMYGADGALSIAISALAQPENWLAVPAGRDFLLAFTLYDSPVSSNKGLIETVFPHIRKTGCHA